MLAFGAAAYDRGRMRRFLARLGLSEMISHISQKFKVVDVADELLETSEHAMFSTADAAPIPSKGLVHQLMAETRHDGRQCMEVVQRVGFLSRIIS